MSNLTDYAKSELTLAGLFNKDSDYDGMLGTAALDIVTLFASQGHSGMSASIVTELVTRLMQYEPLTPLTYEPDEWIEVCNVPGSELWQNRRDSKVFSADHGKTHYRLGDAEYAGRHRADDHADSQPIGYTLHRPGVDTSDEDANFYARPGCPVSPCELLANHTGSHHVSND